MSLLPVQFCSVFSTLLAVTCSVRALGREAHFAAIRSLGVVTSCQLRLELLLSDSVAILFRKVRWFESEGLVARMLRVLSSSQPCAVGADGRFASWPIRYGHIHLLSFLNLEDHWS